VKPNVWQASVRPPQRGGGCEELLHVDVREVQRRNADTVARIESIVDGVIAIGHVCAVDIKRAWNQALPRLLVTSSTLLGCIDEWHLEMPQELRCEQSQSGRSNDSQPMGPFSPFPFLCSGGNCLINWSASPDDH